MRKFLPILCFLVLIPAIAGGFQGYAYLFGGRWQPYEDPLLIDEYGFSDIQNMRKRGKHLIGASGHTKINSVAVDETYKYIQNLFHFKKHSPAESHVLVFAADSTSTGFKLWENSLEPPDTGNFGLTPLIYESTATKVGRFSSAPQGNIIFTNGSETNIWGGYEYRVSAFLTSTAAVSNDLTNPEDYSTKVQNTSSLANQIATINSSDNRYFLIGSTRPLRGCKFYISSGTVAGASLSITYWDGDSWEAVSNAIDNTNGLNETGTISWDDTKDIAKTKYLEGYALYWYQFDLDSSSANVYYVTTNSSMQKLRNIWDGTASTVAVFKKYDGGSFFNYTDEVVLDDESYVATLDSMGTGAAGNYLYVGFTEPHQAIKVKMATLQVNSNNSTMTLNYWDGDSWVAVDGFVDRTSNDSKTLKQDGVISWTPVQNELEFATSIDDSLPLYFYRISFSNALDADTEINYVYGIRNPEELPAYTFSGLFQNRSFLFDESNGSRNKLIYSAYNSPDVWNGPDHGALFFGDESPITAAGTIYNIFRTTGLEQQIVTKTNETYRMYGDGPDNWIIQQMSSNIGCPAPLTMAICELSKFDDDPGRHVLIYQTADGVVMNDGATIKEISQDISVYWDSNDARAIPADRIDDSFGWYDPELNAYKLLISSGSGQTSHNVELEFSLEYNEWTKIHREDSNGAIPLQAGGVVLDAEGNTYSYGGTNDGHIFRTENGQNWDGTAIEQYVTTKNLLIDSERPFLADSEIRYLRLGFVDKNEATGEEMSVIHYCNDSESATGADYQVAPSAVDMTTGPINTQAVKLGPCVMHRFKISGSTSNAIDGIEPTGIGIYFDPKSTISGVNQ